jgi:putative hydrolase
MRPESIQEAMGDPEALLGAVQTQAQRDLLVQIDALTAAVFGFVDHTMDTVGRKLISSYGPLTEALRRRRVEEDEATRMLGRLLGLELRQSQFDRGSAFVRGVLERAGEDGLNRLWRTERDLPTPAEIDAPGLWLARIDLPG